MCNLTRSYIDINGETRTVKFHSHVCFLVQFMGFMVTAKRWVLEDDSMVMIPDTAWELVHVIK